MDGNPVLMTGSRNAGTSASEGGTVYHYTRDSEGRILTKSAWGKTLYEDSYDRDDSQTQVLYANGMRTSYCYDSRNRMTGMETMLPGGELLYRSACTYDRAGNRTGREEQYRDAFSSPLHTAVTTYTYDGMDPSFHSGIGTKILFWINVNHSSTGRCCAGIITMAYTTFGFICFIVFPFHFRADKFHCRNFAF